MYSVLLVDDEPTIREGLRTLIPWEEMGFQVIDTAANGQEALQKCKILLPHLLIADIRMPGMNGLDLVKNLRDQGLDMHVLILSGYADFEYAKQAIANRIDGYLLKPVDEDELTNYLRQLQKQLNEVKAKQQERADEGSMEKVVQSLITKDGQLLDSSPIDSLHWECYEIILVRPITHDEVASSQQIKSKLEVQFDQRQRGIVFAMEPYIGILVKNGIGDGWNQNLIYKTISEACLGHATDFSTAAGGAVQSWKEIVESYRKALSLMKNRFFHESGFLVTAESDLAFLRKRVSLSESENLLTEAIDELYLALDVGNSDAALKLIKEMAEKMKNEGYEEEDFKNMFVQLLTSVFDKFSHHRNEIQSLEFRSGVIDLHKERRYGLLLERVSSIALIIADSRGNTGNDKQIKQMISLIHRNFSENLKLEKLAELFNYNSAYLGKLFKQVTGVHFNTYLDNVRIEQAKLLLEQGNKVYQVATMVGYANVDYFHAKFRKYVGSSPSSYRRKG